MKICRVCGVELVVGKNWTESLKKYYSNICLGCEKIRVKNPKYRPAILKYRVEHKDEIKKCQKEYRLNNLDKERKRNQDYSKSDAGKKSRKNNYNNLRYEIINHYSNGAMKCMCPGCNEDHLDFLTIDHINNNGSEHRREIGTGGTRLLKWILKNKFPSGFQILCMNCNFSKGKHGFCSKHR